MTMATPSVARTTAAILRTVAERNRVPRVADTELSRDDGLQIAAGDAQDQKRKIENGGRAARSDVEDAIVRFRLLHQKHVRARNVGDV